jgi:hypothetical protein
MTDQPRDRAVPCRLCGHVKGKPSTATWNSSAICDRHMTATERHLGEGRSILRMDEAGMRHWQRPATTNRKAQS